MRDSRRLLLLVLFSGVALAGVPASRKLRRRIQLRLRLNRRRRIKMHSV